MGQEEDATLAATAQTGPQMRVGTEDRTQLDVVRPHQCADATAAVPVRDALKLLLVFSTQNPGAVSGRPGLVPPQWRPRSGGAVLRRAAFAPPYPRSSAVRSVPLPRVSHLLPDPSPERGAQGSAVSVWVPSSAPPAKLHRA